MSIRRRGAFTLVELLVVITIIGMLMALLLPAVNAAVEAARNIQCKNNVGQLAKATEVYQAQKERYPGYVNTVGSTTDAGWVVALLPQIERLDLYTEWTNGNPKAVYMDLLVCPSDPPEQISSAVLSYVANSGYATQAFGTEAEKKQALANGIFHEGTVFSTVDTITDGKTNTLLFSENIQADMWDTSDRVETTFVWHSGTPHADCSINANKSATTADLNRARPSSYHSGGVNVAFADTHVIFLKQDVEYGVYRQLMTPYGAKSNASSEAVLDDSKFK